MNTGKPLFVNIDKILDAAEEFIMGDDGQKAMWLLDNLPAYYMDNYPARAYEIKRSYYKRLWTLEDYLKNEFSKTWDEERALKHYQDPNQWRGIYAKNIVKTHSDNNCKIHVVELGAENYWLPIGMKHDNLKFTYQSIGPDYEATKQAKEKLKDIWDDDPQPGTSILFVCMETIEHCMNPMDVFNYYCKLPREAEYIVMSTPRYMIGGSMAGVYDWRNKDHGHVKTWGEGEFKSWAEKTFKMHEFYSHDKQHLIVSGMLKKLVNMTKTIPTTDGKEA